LAEPIGDQLLLQANGNHQNLSNMNEHIVDFIQKQKVATLCCVDEEKAPYCFSCFFAFDEVKHLLYFKTSASSHHGRLLQQNGRVSGTINPDKLNSLAIKGIQFSGQVVEPDDSVTADASAIYHKKYPFAYAMKGDIWTVRVTTIKMTDNTLGFGKKITWKLENCAPVEDYIFLKRNIISS
jgi:uncharacterized protein YhbP (UPF0306 family)